MRALGGIGLVDGLWLLFLAYWILSARNTAETKAQESTAIRLASTGLLVLAAALIGALAIPLDPLDGRFVPRLTAVRAVGAAVTGAGLAFAVWARFHLGRNWSGRVELREGHELIDTGPYSVIRHPIYTGILAALAGTALWVGEYRALAGLVLFAVGLGWKARREEALLLREFGETYARYQRRTGMLLPRLSARGSAHRNNEG